MIQNIITYSIIILSVVLLLKKTLILFNSFFGKKNICSRSCAGCKFKQQHLQHMMIQRKTNDIKSSNINTLFTGK